MLGLILVNQAEIQEEKQQQQQQNSPFEFKELFIQPSLFFFSPEVFLLSFHRNHCKDVTQCMARKLLVTVTVLSLSSFHSITVSLLLSNPFESMQVVGSGGSP